MRNTLIIFIVVMILMALYSREHFNFEWLSELWQKVNLFGNSPAAVGAPYQNMCLTCKPFGFHDPKFYYWYNRESNLPKEVSTCNMYQCRTPQLNGWNALGTQDYTSYSPRKTDVHSISVDYYHDPVSYCAVHPNRYPCPNYWVSRKWSGKAKRYGDFPTEDLRLPKMKDHVLPQVKTPCRKCCRHELSGCAVNDNERTLIVGIQKEDHATC